MILVTFRSTMYIIIKNLTLLKNLVSFRIIFLKSLTVVLISSLESMVLGVYPLPKSF